MTMRYPVLPHRATAEEAEIERKMEQFRRTACLAEPMTNADYIRTVSEEIVRRAQILGQHWPIRVLDVAAFFLERSEAWILSGTPVNQIGPKLPKNLNDIGLMMIAEGSQQLSGLPLTREELAVIKKEMAKKVH